MRLRSPLRRGLPVTVLAVSLTWAVLPGLRQARLSRLAHLGAGWLACGALLQVSALLCYSLLTRSLLPARGPGLATVVRADLSCSALAHTVPAGSAAGARIPRVGAASAERPVRAFAAGRRRVRRALLGAAANWLLEAAALWCFLAALGRYTDPVVLFAAFGIANVVAALPLTPGGLGIIEAVPPLLLAGGGVTRGVAALAVIGWRLVSVWLPIPAGAAAYASLQLPRGNAARPPASALSMPAGV